MTTTIKDTYSASDLVTLGPQSSGDGKVRIVSTQGLKRCINVLNRAEFLAAVATECDAIVIPRADLPTFKDWEKELVLAGAVDAESLRRQGLLSFAMAEHLDAHPLVDQAQVDALATALKDHPLFGLGRLDADVIARDLLATGKVQVTA